MPITNREKMIAGFSWSAGNTGFSIDAMADLLDAAELVGCFDADFVARAAAGKYPSIDEIMKRIQDTTNAMKGKKI